MIRCGSFGGYAEDEPALIVEGGGTNTTVADNQIIDPMFEGIQILGTWNVQFLTNIISLSSNNGHHDFLGQHRFWIIFKAISCWA